MVARLAPLDRRRGSDYAFVLKWVLANPKNRSNPLTLKLLYSEEFLFAKLKL